MRCRFSAILLTLTVLIVFNVHQPAIGSETPIGKIDKVEGEVTVTRSDGQEMMGSVDFSLLPGDQITTGKDAMVRFSFQEGGQFRLGEKAQMSVDELSGPEVEEDEPILQLVLGYLWSRIQKIKGQPGRLALHTPTAIIGVHKNPEFIRFQFVKHFKTIFNSQNQIQKVLDFVQLFIKIITIHVRSAAPNLDSIVP